MHVLFLFMVPRMAPVFERMTGEQLRKKRILLGYKQEEIAFLCGISRQTVYNIELEKTAKKSNVYLIAVCLDRLYDRCENKSIKTAIDVLGI